MIIGICGKSGSGKSTIAKQIVSNHKNAVHLDIDKIGHLSHKNKEVKEKLINTFSSSILTNNEIDRKKLSVIVFSSKEEMKKLEKITWTFMENEIDKFIKENKDKIIILDYILLPLTKYFKQCDIKILMNIPYQIRKERVLNRDNITEESFVLRESSSIEYEEYDFDIILNNEQEDILRRIKI
ncbi:MAG: dephospho-CoA kinase [Bacilli bacterium]|nr:dephospho-CoA kinase [Bacilli bacterium]